MEQTDFDLDMAQLDILGDSDLLEVSPPHFPDVAETDYQEMKQRRQRIEDMLLYMPPKPPSPPKQEEKQPLKLSDTERQYIGHAFERDPALAEFVMEMASIVADVEQELPDPLFPEGEADLFAEEFPEGEYDILESSPEKTPEVFTTSKLFICNIL